MPFINEVTKKIYKKRTLAWINPRYLGPRFSRFFIFISRCIIPKLLDKISP